MNVAFRFDPQPCQLEEGRGLVVLLERFGLGLKPGRFGFELPLGVGDAQLLDFHLGAAARPRLALDAFGADLLRFGGGAGAGHGRFGLELGGKLAGLGLGDRMHAHDLRLALFVDAPRLGGFPHLDDLDLTGALGVRHHAHRFDGVLGLLALGGADEPLGFRDLQLPGLGGERDLAVALRLLAGEKAVDVGTLALAFFADQRNLAAHFLELPGQRAAYLGGFALRGFLDNGDVLLDLRGFQRLLFVNFLLLDFPALSSTKRCCSLKIRARSSDISFSCLASATASSRST